VVSMVKPILPLFSTVASTTMVRTRPSRYVRQQVGGKDRMY